MDGLKLEEYKFLRQEHENNRRFVFERPLVIVGATLAAAFSLSEKGLLGMMPVPFLAVLIFNLWFTFNRLASSARIVAYLQLVLEPSAQYRWIGWESSLRLYRTTTGTVERERRIESAVTERVSKPQTMWFYRPIFFFHMALGILVTFILISQSDSLQRLLHQQGKYTDLLAMITNVVAMLVFAGAFWSYRPSKLHGVIDQECQVWPKVLHHLELQLQRTSGMGHQGVFSSAECGEAVQG